MKPAAHASATPDATRAPADRPPARPPWRAARSLRLRLLAATLVTLAMALAGAHSWLGSLFREHVQQQFDTALTQQLDQVTARLDVGPSGQPRIDAQRLSDPRWSRPFAGLYWQLDQLSADGLDRRGVLRSRSLWDAQLNLQPDALADGALHTHDSTGPQGEAVRVVERAVQLTTQGHTRWRLMVAADTRETLAAAERFNGVLAASLTGLGLLLALAALAQVAVGLAPLKTLQHALQQLREGRTQRLQGAFPAEVQALIDDFNGVLDHQADSLARARTQAGNLAHALKTPLAVLDNAARQADTSGLGPLVAEQVAVAQRHIQWHLARARVAATQGLPGQRTPLEPVLAGLMRVMGKVHAPRALDLDATDMPAGAAFAGEEQDLQDMLGNLLDNACRCARSAVRVHARVDGARLHITVEDDGPGISPEQREAVLRRGVRLDESTPGSGLGLAIVVELAQLYGGGLALGAGPTGGLLAQLSLPAAT